MSELKLEKTKKINTDEQHQVQATNEKSDFNFENSWQWFSCTVIRKTNINYKQD